VISLSALRSMRHAQQHMLSSCFDAIVQATS